MKNGKRIWTALFVMCCFIPLMMFSASPAAAAAELLPTADDNLTVSLRCTSGLTATEDGYMRVFFDGKQVRIEYLDDDFNVQSKKSIDMELSIWGGFYAGSDAYYLVEGQNNREEIDTAEVIRVIRYDADWNRTGAANITGNMERFGGEVRYPFNTGCVEMTEHEGMLYIVTGHEGYVDPAVGQGHQGYLMIAVDEASMTGKITDSDLWHSFAQYIDGNDSNLYVLEQSEGSRYAKISKCEYTDKPLRGTPVPVLQYGGNRTSAWAVSCYASVDGMALSADNVLTIGTSIDQENYESVTSDTAHNLYLTVTPMADFSEEATAVKWLTDYSGHGECFLGTKITKINDNRFLISWEEYVESREKDRAADADDTLSASVLHYVFVDGEGNTVSREFTAAAPISECRPIVKGSKVVYCASSANMVNFYSIDAQTGAFSKKGYRVAGENAAWNLDNGVLTISGNGDMSVDTEAHYRRPISSTSGGYSYSSADNAWKPIRNKVQKIVIEEGITGVSENAFQYFNSLTEAELKEGVKSIGAKAFYSCGALSKITIPASVTSIGEDFLWTGSSWIHDGSHVVKAEIYAPDNSYAMNYAKEHNIRCTDSDKKPEEPGDPGQESGDAISISKAAVSGIKTSYAYTGKAQIPSVTVKLGSKTLKKGTDYTVTCTKNKNTGRATVKIKGIHRYTGTITKTFNIVPKKASLSKAVSKKARTMTISWKKDGQADGYQLQYAKNAKFTSGKKNITLAKNTSVSKTIPKLAKNKKYYVHVRAYKKISGKTYYGAWSKTGAATIK